MADTKGSALTTLAIDSLDPANDLLNPIDVSDTTMGAGGTNKKMTAKNLISKSLEDLARTWNNAAVNFDAISMDVTDSASGSGSNLLNLKVGGTSRALITHKSTGCKLNLRNTFGDIAYVEMQGGQRSSKFGQGASYMETGGNNLYLSVNNLPYIHLDRNSQRLSLGIENVANVWLTSNLLEQRNGANAQTFNIYNTYTDGSNYERGGLRWNSNELQLVTDNAGTGSVRGVRIGVASNPRLTINQSGVSATGNFSHSGGVFTVSTGPTFNATWNSGATVFTGVELNVTDTASDAASLLMDLQVGGASQVSVQKNGWLQAKAISAGSSYGFIFGQPTLYYMIFGGNSEGLTLSSARFIGFSNSPFNMTAASADTRLYRDAANILAQRNGANAQAFNIYNTYTDASNYERGALLWDTNNFTLDSSGSGTGSNARSIVLRIGGTNRLTISTSTISCRHKLVPTVGSLDLGASNSPWYDIYLHPSSSLTPTSNGDLCIEATNNTTLTFKLKGSDGTVRSGTVALL